MFSYSCCSQPSLEHSRLAERNSRRKNLLFVAAGPLLLVLPLLLLARWW